MRKQGQRLSLTLGGKPGAPRCQGVTMTKGKQPRVTKHAGGRHSTEAERGGAASCTPSRPAFSAMDKFHLYSLCTQLVWEK